MPSGKLMNRATPCCRTSKQGLAGEPSTTMCAGSCGKAVQSAGSIAIRPTRLAALRAEGPRDRRLETAARRSGAAEGPRADLLPLDRTKIKSVAVIGPPAFPAIPAAAAAPRAAVRAGAPRGAGQRVGPSGEKGRRTKTVPPCGEYNHGVAHVPENLRTQHGVVTSPQRRARPGWSASTSTIRRERTTTRSPAVASTSSSRGIAPKYGERRRPGRPRRVGPALHPASRPASTVSRLQPTGSTNIGVSGGQS